MFNKALKEEVEKLKQENQELYKKQFRVGDMVYIQDGSRNPLTPYYLIKPYNGNECYYISTSKEALFLRESISNGVHISNISHNKPEQCKCCGELLTQKQG